MPTVQILHANTMSSNPSVSITSSIPPRAAAQTLDDAIEKYIGNFGWKQFLQTTIISLARFFDAQQTFVTIFTDATPKWSCKNQTGQYFNVSSCNDDVCKLPRDSWSWDLPAGTSTVSEWSLQCAGPITRGLLSSSFLIGSMIGGIVLAMLADSSLGRKNLLVLSCLIMSLSGVLAAFSNNIWMYSGLRFVSGLGRGTIGGCALVLASELIGKKWRERVGILGYLWFTLGFLSLPLIAFLLRGHSWRLIYLTTSIPCIVYSLIVYFAVHESPRWLFIRGRKEDFVKTLKSLSTGRQVETLAGNLEAEETGQNDAVYSALRILLQKRWALKRLVIVMVVGSGIGMTYFGMPFGLGNLQFDLYLSTTLNALAEIPTTLVLFLMIRKLDRKVSMVGFCTLSGICGVGSVLVEGNKGIQLGFELVSFFGACTALNVLVIYTLELFPTSVRNTAVSATRQAFVLGGAVSPVLVAAAARRRNGWLSYGVFGAAVAILGLGVVWLPEMRGKTLSDTVEEEDEKSGRVRGDV